VSDRGLKQGKKFRNLGVENPQPGIPRQGSGFSPASASPSFKELVFKEEANPAIKCIKKACFWAMVTFPDLTQCEGIKKAALWMFYVALFLSMSGWVVQTGVTPLNILVKMAILTAVVGAVNIGFISTAIYGFLVFWELTVFDKFGKKGKP